MKEKFEARLKAVKRGEEATFSLSDYDVLGEELAIIRALADQLTLYADMTPPGGKKEIIRVKVDTLWGLGQAIKNLAEKLEGRIKALDATFALKARGKQGEEK